MLSDCHVLLFQTLAEAKRIMESRAASKVSDQCMQLSISYKKVNLSNKLLLVTCMVFLGQKYFYFFL